MEYFATAPRFGITTGGEITTLVAGGGFAGTLPRKVVWSSCSRVLGSSHHDNQLLEAALIHPYCPGHRVHTGTEARHVSCAFRRLQRWPGLCGHVEVEGQGYIEDDVLDPDDHMYLGRLIVLKIACLTPTTFSQRNNVTYWRNFVSRLEGLACGARTNAMN